MRNLLFITLILLSLSSHGQNWQLVWSDDFDGPLLDDTKWTHNRGNGVLEGIPGWGNGELQYYQEQNSSISNGILKIEAREEPQGISDSYSGNVPYYYSSSKIITRDKFEFLYGRVEARIKTVDGQGMWPAFWMLAGGCWPETGEIDIMEQWGNDGNTSVTTGAAHLGNCGSGSTYVAGSTGISSGSYADDFHVYAVEWFQDQIYWYVDDVLFHSVTPASYPSNLTWPFNSNDWYIILNLAITSGGPNQNTTFPNDIQIDYVRVYEFDQSALPQVTFQVDMSLENIDPTDIVYVNGSFNDWCGVCNPMTDLGNGIWEITIPLDPGQIEYKFTTNGWTGLIEEFAPETECCLTTYAPEETFVNRVAQVTTSDLSLDLVCFNSCESCFPQTEGCTDPTAVNYDPGAAIDDGSCEYQVHFLVDMNSYPGTFTAAEVNGTFNGWCGACDVMSDADGDGIWSILIDLPLGFHEFKFAVDNWADQENFTGLEDCTLTTGPFVNRKIQVNGNMTYGPVCWESCDPCPSDCQVFDTPPVDLTKSFDPVNGIQDRVQVKWYKDTPAVKYSDEDAAACDIKFWAKRNLDPSTGNPIGPTINGPDTILIQDAKKSYGNGDPREIFKWPIKFRADGANNNKRAEPNIRYEWQVRCACEHGLGQESPWSTVRIFNTPDFDPSIGIYSPPPGIILLDKASSQIQTASFQLIPNPSANRVQLLFNGVNDEVVMIQICSMTGKIIEEYSEMIKSNSLLLHFDDAISSGIYLVNVQLKDKKLVQRMLIDR